MKAPTTTATAMRTPTAIMILVDSVERLSSLLLSLLSSPPSPADTGVVVEVEVELNDGDDVGEAVGSDIVGDSVKQTVLRSYKSKFAASLVPPAVVLLTVFNAHRVTSLPVLNSTDLQPFVSLQSATHALTVSCVLVKSVYDND